MKFKKFTITEKDFAKYGISSHYDLDVMIEKTAKKVKSSKSDSAKKVPSIGGKQKRARSLSKGVSNVKGENTGRIIKGFASTGHKDRAKDVITDDALHGAVSDLLKQGSNTTFLNHDTNLPIGRVLKSVVKKDGNVNGIYIEMMISKASDVEDTWIRIKEGILNAFSIRLQPKKVEVLENPDTGQIEQFNILSMELLEVSVVGIPCNASCAITSVIGKSFKNSIRKLNKKQVRKVAVKKNSKTNQSRRRKSASTSTGLSKEARAEVSAIIKESNSGLLGEIKSLIAPKAPVKKKRAKKVVKKAATSDSQDALVGILAGLQTSVDSMNKNMKRSNRRKSRMDGNDDDNGIPSKVLKSATDVDTLKYVHYAANHAEVYKELSADEKVKVNGIYIQMTDAATTAS